MNLSTLSHRERQAFYGVAMGVNVKCMAYDLGLTVSTVRKFRERMFKKTGLLIPARVTAYALTHNMVKFADNKLVLP